VTLLELLTSDPDTPLATLATTEPLTASPEDDQEDVAENIAKYNLLAMPVVDEDRHILGIVTVDDALEVLQEEHEEDLQIAGSPAGSSPDDRGGLLSQLLTSEMWLFLWAVGVALCTLPYGAATGNYELGLALSVGLPIALRVADAMVRYVINSYLEYDEDDEDAPTLLGFAVKGVVVSAVFAAVVLLLYSGVNSMVTSAAFTPDNLAADVRLSWLQMLLEQVENGFRAAAVTSVASFVTAPFYLLSLRSRDKLGKDTSGVAMRAVGMVCALAVYIIAALFFYGWMW